MNKKTIIVTGGAGFIGSNIIEGLNQLGITDIIVVDNLSTAHKFKNIVDLHITEFIDKQDFIASIQQSPHKFKHVAAIFHQGACSDTMEHNGQYMMKNNFAYSKQLFAFCQEYQIPFLYASSAATYGNETTFIEQAEYEKPLNIYGYSKLLFDNYLRHYMQNHTLRAQVVGFRYFNVYGPRECHKGKMASVAFHHYMQYMQHKKVKLFGEYAGYGAGEHTRDFIYVGDVVHANLAMWQHANISGIFNLGTGKAEPFNNIAHSMLNACLSDENTTNSSLTLNQLIENNMLEYIPFPNSLVGKYQSYTQANLINLRTTNFNHNFLSVAQGVQKYYAWLKQNYAYFAESST
jgi:ADP-L-glycero-D-manno-heptose 6-epimerase